MNMCNDTSFKNGKIQIKSKALVDNTCTCMYVFKDTCTAASACVCACVRSVCLLYCRTDYY